MRSSPMRENPWMAHCSFSRTTPRGDEALERSSSNAVDVMNNKALLGNGAAGRF